MRRIIRIRNLDCAACAAELKEELEELEGIEEAAVDFINQRVTLSYGSPEAFSGAVKVIAGFEEVEIIDGNAPRKKENHLKEIVSIAVSAVFFVPGLVLHLLGGVPEWLPLALFLASFAAAGWEVVLTVCKNFVKLFRSFRLSLLFDENFLMLIASVGAFALGEGMEGAVVMLLYEIGELLQSVAVGSSRGAIAKLMELKSDSAILVEGDTQREVAPEELKKGDIILLRKGDKVPADCTLLSGESAFDTKSITGESYLRECGAGAELLAGFLNAGNAVTARVERPSEESAVAKILEMVENASSQKAKPEKFITRFARIYTPVVVGLAVLLAVVPPLFTGFDFAPWIMRALNFLVISCPCALIISVPLTYFSGVGVLAKHGVLCKGAVCLDTLAKVQTAALDKTGTLTEGKFTLAGCSSERALSLIAAVERASSHPFAEAFRNEKTPFHAENVQEIAGMGLAADVEGRQVLVGSRRLMEEHSIALPALQSPHAVVFCAEDGAFVGYAELEDKLRPDAKEALVGLKGAGIQKIAVLSGDTEERARAALQGLPVDELHAGLLPEEKPLAARALKGEGALLYVGDGINDTPVMAESDVAVAMGGLGSDAAIEASDLVLASDSLNGLPKAMRTAKKTRNIVLENIIGSIAIKAALMVLSIVGVVPLWAAVFGDVGVMLLAVLNSLRMRGRI